MPHVAVIGAGIMGSWAAYHLCQGGATVTVFDQFPLPHSRGSSTGQARILRYTGERDLAIIADAERQWLQLERRLGKQLLVRSGRLNIYSADDDSEARRFCADLALHGIAHQVLAADELRRRFPMLTYPDCAAIYEPNAALILAPLALQGLHAEFQSLGGKIVTGEAGHVTGLSFDAQSVQLTLRNKQTARFDKVCVCAGPWSSEMLKGVPVRTEAIAVCYWSEKQLGAYSVANGFPATRCQIGKESAYCVPSYEYPGLVKIVCHGGPVAPPHLRDTVDQSGRVAALSAHIGRHFPLVDAAQPALVERCMYTCPPDQTPIIDYHEQSRRIAFAAGFYGEGFKASPAFGRILAHMTLEQTEALPYDTESLRMSRFIKSKV